MLVEARDPSLPNSCHRSDAIVYAGRWDGSWAFGELVSSFKFLGGVHTDRSICSGHSLLLRCVETPYLVSSDLRTLDGDKANPNPLRKVGGLLIKLKQLLGLESLWRVLSMFNTGDIIESLNTIDDILNELASSMVLSQC
jgi:hypothetical protein